jgi:uncharacterized protein (TIGR02452 family)
MAIGKSIAVCIQNQKILNANAYYLNEDKVSLNHTIAEHKSVKVISPEEILYIEKNMEKNEEQINNHSSKCNIQVVNADSYRYKTELVMNFANATNPGGGYLLGANAQEESLCRESTLYASIASKEAKEMYHANRRNKGVLPTDYMLLSPKVDVFRNDSLELLEEPYSLAVISIAAPNLAGRGRMIRKEIIDNYMIRRIRQYLKCSAYYGYRTITLGAWGCGEFKHDAGKVAEYFRKVIIDEEYRKYFDKILFAVYDKSVKQYNYRSFQEAFSRYT